MRDLLDGTRPRSGAPSLERLRERRSAILEVCARNGASDVRVFGSVARGEEDEESDVDLLVVMEKGRSLFDLAGLILELETLLGCPVNVVSEGGVRPGSRFAKRMRKELVPL